MRWLLRTLRPRSPDPLAGLGSARWLELAAAVAGEDRFAVVPDAAPYALVVLLFYRAPVFGDGSWPRPQPIAQVGMPDEVVLETGDRTLAVRTGAVELSAWRFAWPTRWPVPPPAVAVAPELPELAGTERLLCRGIVLRRGDPLRVQGAVAPIGGETSPYRSRVTAELELGSDPERGPARLLVPVAGDLSLAT